MSSEEIEALSSKGRQALTKYINGLTKLRHDDENIFDESVLNIEVSWLIGYYQ